MEWCGNEVTGVECSDMMEQSEVSQCGLRMKTGMGGIRQCGLRRVWTGMTESGVWMHWSRVETNKSQVKYEANVAS